MREISAQELLSIQREVQTILNTTCKILTRTESYDHGSSSPVFTAGNNIKCRLTPLSARETFYADKLNGEVGYSILLPHSTVVSNIDKIQVGTREFQIIGIKSYPSMPALIRAICEEITE